MKTRLKFFMLVLPVIVLLSSLSGCASNSVKPQQSFDKLRPIDVVPLATTSPNLVIQLNNVADSKKAAAKRIKLFINDKEILPNAETYRSPESLVYRLQLAAGVYKIKAVYHAKTFWRDKEHIITTQDGRVRVYPNHQTVLNLTFDKKTNGDLKQKKNYFAEQVEALSTPVFQTPVATPLPATTVLPEKIETAQVESRSDVQIFPIAVLNEESRRVLPAPEPGRRIEFPDPMKSITSPRPERRLPGEAAPSPPSVVATPQPDPIDQTPKPAQPIPAPIQPVPEPVRVQPQPELERPLPVPDRAGSVLRSPEKRDKIALQINTVPIHCDIIVDDKMVGQSPLTVYVDRFSSHVIQISHAGYEDKTRLLEHHIFGNETTYIFLEKLEPKK